LADKLSMKSAANVSQQMRWLARKKALAAAPDSLRLFQHEADAAQPDLTTDSVMQLHRDPILSGAPCRSN
jgi:hypothetical protein